MGATSRETRLLGRPWTTPQRSVPRTGFGRPVGPAAAWRVGGLSPWENACFLFLFPRNGSFPWPWLFLGMAEGVAGCAVAILPPQSARRRHSSAQARPFCRLCFRLPGKDRRCVRSKAWLRAHATVQRAWQWITSPGPSVWPVVFPSRGRATEIRQFANSRCSRVNPGDFRGSERPFSARQWHSVCWVVCLRMVVPHEVGRLFS
jgi:hypothetical protein